MTANGNSVLVSQNGSQVLDLQTTEDLDINDQGGDDTLDGSALQAGVIDLDFDGGAGNDTLTDKLALALREG